MQIYIVVYVRSRDSLNKYLPNKAYLSTLLKLREFLEVKVESNIGQVIQEKNVWH